MKSLYMLPVGGCAKSLADEAGQDDLECLQGHLKPMCWPLQLLTTATANIVGQAKRGQDTFWSRFWRSRCRCLFRFCLPVATWHLQGSRSKRHQRRRHTRSCGGDDELLHVALVEQRIHVILWNSCFRLLPVAANNVQTPCPAGLLAGACRGAMAGWTFGQAMPWRLRGCWQFFQWLGKFSLWPKPV